MAEDIVPGLLEKIHTDFKKNYDKSEIVNRTMKKLRDKTSTYPEANDYSIEVGRILSDVLTKHISEDVLPDGKMYYNIGKRVLESTLRNNHQLISDYVGQTQINLNNKYKIGPKAVIPQFNQDRIDGFINRLDSEDNFDKVKWILKEPIITFSQSIVDDSAKENFEFQAKAELNPKIKRTVVGGCCDWCSKLAGTYSYPVKNPDVFRRHEFCRCTVDFLPDGIKGKHKQNVHTKKTTEISKEDRKEYHRREEEKRKLSNQRLKNIAEIKAKEAGLNPVQENQVVNIMRNESTSWIESLTPEEKRSIKKYTDNGRDPDGMKFYQKMNGYLKGEYDPIDEVERESLERNIDNCREGILKSRINPDIIVYRRSLFPSTLEGKNEQLISTSVTRSGAINKRPNVAILVPKGTKGAYVEKLSNYGEQREFLLPPNIKLEKLFSDSELYVYKVVN